MPSGKAVAGLKNCSSHKTIEAAHRYRGKGKRLEYCSNKRYTEVSSAILNIGEIFPASGHNTWFAQLLISMAPAPDQIAMMMESVVVSIGCSGSKEQYGFPSSYSHYHSSTGWEVPNTRSASPMW